MATDTEILNWLEKNCGYFEHGELARDDGYWPQKEGELPAKERFIGLDLRAYVAARIAEEK